MDTLIGHINHRPVDGRFWSVSDSCFAIHIQQSSLFALCGIPIQSDNPRLLLRIRSRFPSITQTIPDVGVALNDMRMFLQTTIARRKWIP